MKAALMAAFAVLPCTHFALAAPPAAKQWNPADPGAPAGAFRYESAFDNYRAATAESQPVKAWRSANDEMGKLGGHAGHMKEAAGQAATVAPREANDAAHARHR
jgi:hypothetical protein